MRKVGDDLGAVKLHVGMLARYLGETERRASGVYYVDNHLRTYTGKQVVPNPARRRLDRDLAEAITAQRDLEALRAGTPKRAPLSETELAGKLVRHDGRVKMVLDSIRIACANLESDLAAELAPHLPKPREAKKTLANLLAAPERVRVRLRTIAVDLAPAATSIEGMAFGELCKQVNRRNLTLPGDPRRRRLRFKSQIE